MQGSCPSEAGAEARSDIRNSRRDAFIHVSQQPLADTQYPGWAVQPEGAATWGLGSVQGDEVSPGGRVGAGVIYQEFWKRKRGITVLVSSTSGIQWLEPMDVPFDIGASVGLNIAL